jgi:ATP-dependent protease ClpP protease subunit
MVNKRRIDELPQILSDIHTYNINYHTRELYLHSRYGDDSDEPGVDYRMATTFIKNLAVLEQQSHENILVHMHTIGGEWGDGMAIFDAIRFSKATVNVLAYAQASSMSGIILQAADKRILMPDCYVLIHHGSIVLEQNSVAAKSGADWSDINCKRMLQIFAERAIIGPYFKERKWGVGQVKSFIDRKIKEKVDWYLSAQEAVEYGLADGILGQEGFETIRSCRVGRKWKLEVRKNKRK